MMASSSILRRKSSILLFCCLLFDFINPDFSADSLLTLLFSPELCRIIWVRKETKHCWKQKTISFSTEIGWHKQSFVISNFVFCLLWIFYVKNIKKTDIHFLGAHKFPLHLCLLALGHYDCDWEHQKHCILMLSSSKMLCNVRKTPLLQGVIFAIDSISIELFLLTFYLWWWTIEGWQDASGERHYISLHYSLLHNLATLWSSSSEFTWVNVPDFFIRKKKTLFEWGSGWR